jgi:Zn-dependent M28 family amino/carboxypeptidase
LLLAISTAGTGAGAIDDASGCGIITAAALEASKSGQLARTIRVLWAGTEEMGGFGGQAYAAAHGNEPHAIVMESDTGADKVFRALFKLSAQDKPLAERIGAELAKMGIYTGEVRPKAARTWAISPRSRSWRSSTSIRT